MRIIFLFFLVVSMFLGARSVAQVIVTGKVYDRESREILYLATVKNKSTGEGNFSDLGGNYRISAKEYDVIIFSFVGYYPDSITVTVSKGTEVRDVFLHARPHELSGVEVTAGLTPYQVDSINRRRQFREYLAAPRYKMIGGNGDNGNTPGGFGISISPFTFFSKAEKQKRKFDRMYAVAERQKFIDSRYTRELVSRVTGLKGDSLAYFMNSHQPAYEFVRTASDMELMYWIKYTYKEYAGNKKK